MPLSQRFTGQDGLFISRSNPSSMAETSCAAYQVSPGSQRFVVDRPNSQPGRSIEIAIRWQTRSCRSALGREVDRWRRRDPLGHAAAPHEGVEVDVLAWTLFLVVGVVVLLGVSLEIEHVSLG